MNAKNVFWNGGTAHRLQVSPAARPTAILPVQPGPVTPARDDGRRTARGRPGLPAASRPGQAAPKSLRDVQTFDVRRGATPASVVLTRVAASVRCASVSSPIVILLELAL